MSHLILDHYLDQVRQGHLDRDAAQEAVVVKLDELREKLRDYRPSTKSGALGWLLGARRVEPIRGLYIWGSVGRGKTMLMDLFFSEAQVQRKTRVHFHAFLADVHAQVHAWRQAKKLGEVKGDDPIVPVADTIADKSYLLCFDEFTVTDIADAMILGRLFEALFARGVVIVATSNVDPTDLYKDGLNRALFLPFIALLRQRMEVVKLDSRTDFRLEKLGGAAVYHVPPDAAAAAALSKAFKALTGHDEGSPVSLPLLGRTLRIPQAAANVARFSYADLCQQPLGANDYLAIARHFHTVLVDGIPVMQQDNRNETKRFITFIDALYDQHVKLIASAEAEPTGLYKGTHGREFFEFDRTASRLIEMRSASYLSLPHGEAASIGSGDSSGLVET